MAAMRGRMRKEIAMLESDPPFGVSAWPKDDQIDRLQAQILGPDGSPYEKGVFHLDIEIPERYPFEPPKVHFVTPIYHPNIDDAGRICLDTLKMQPKGSWLPSVNISTLLTTIRLLMAEPNADDGLMPEIADVFKHNRELFNKKATELTIQHAQDTKAHQRKSATDTTAGSGNLKDDDGEKEDSADSEAPTQDTQTTDIMSQRKESISSDDSFSDGNSSSDEEDSGSNDENDDNEEKHVNPPAKRRRQE
ncbi:Ubiquitin-conjugating enzyme E2 [Phytophthora megakarya]|uniref:E2 ubiquitin-conjugating enzyme n=1 Tax=Phytophthora megakarya TaxID=4795 RepID=A0A225VWD6_9STRA|nr:Ubiquitin-conjugating enzyme E2 [Phytophthora megakarya]